MPPVCNFIGPGVVGLIEINSQWYRLHTAWGVWFAKGKILWLFLFVLLGACLVVDWIGCYAGLSRVDRLPYSGWILESAGIIAIAYGFSKKIDLYGVESPFTRFGKWLRSIPIFKQNRNVFCGTAKMTLSPGQATITASVGLPPDADLDMRLTRAERLIKGLGKGLAQLKIDTRSGLAGLEAKFREEIEEIKTEISEVRELTGKAHVGDVGMELAGLGWVIVGLTLATIPNFVYSVSKPIVDYLSWFNCTH